MSRIVPTDLPLFDGCTDRELADAGRLFAHVVVEPGTVLVRPGTRGIECIVIVSGSATLERHGVPLGLLRAGDVAGEIALFDGVDGERATSVRAADECGALVCSRAEFDELTAHQPALAARIRRAARTRSSDGDLLPG